MSRKILVVLLVLVIAFACVACDGEEPPTAQEQEIVSRATQALDDISSYRFELVTSLDMSGESGGETFAGTIVTTYDGALDLAQREGALTTTMTTTMTMTDMDEAEVNSETYIIDDVMYMMTATPDTEPTWIKAAVPAEYWEEMNQVEPQLEILGTSQIDVVGSQSVGGVDCYVLEVTLDTEQLWQLFMQSTGLTDNMITDGDEESLNEMFRSYSAKQWVAKDSYFLMKVELEMDLEITPELMGSPDEEGEAAMNIAMTMLVYDYNQPVTIELPPGAEDAVEY